MDQGTSLKKVVLSDEGIVIGWLLKVSLIFIIIGFFLFEIVGVVLVRATAADTASKAAQEAGYMYRQTSSLERAKETAKQFAESEGAEFVDLKVDLKNNTASVTVRKKAKTIFIQKISSFDKYTTITAVQTAPMPA